MRFDIILPTVGRDSLRTAVESVIAQTYKNWQLHIVGDGIGVELLHPYFEMDGRIEASIIVERSHDSGTAARRAAIDHGHNEWIAYIDDDDVWLPHHLDTIVTLIDVSNNMLPGTNMARTAGQQFSWKHRSPRSSELIRKMGPINMDDPMTVGMAHTRELYEKTAGWQPVDNHDHLLWEEMHKKGGYSVAAPIVTFEFER